MLRLGVGIESVFFAVDATEQLAHQHDELQGATVTDAVVDAVCILACLQDLLVTQDREMLGDVALRGADGFDDVLHAQLALAQHAQDLEAQWMGDRLEGARGRLDMLILVDQGEVVVLVHGRADGDKAVV